MIPERAEKQGRIWIWYTDDDQHLPVQMRAKLFWGTLTVYLTSISQVKRRYWTTRKRSAMTRCKRGL